MDVGVSHLNMNINVIGGGHGLGSTTTTTAVGVQGSTDANTGDSASSSPPVGAPETSLCAALSPSLCLAMYSCLFSGLSLAWLAACRGLCLWRRRSEALDRPPIHTYHTSHNRFAEFYCCCILHAIHLHPMASDRCTAAMGSLAGPLASANQRASPVAKPLHGLLLSFAHLSMNEAHEMIDLRASCLSYDT